MIDIENDDFLVEQFLIQEIDAISKGIEQGYAFNEKQLKAIKDYFEKTNKQIVYRYLKDSECYVIGLADRRNGIRIDSKTKEYFKAIPTFKGLDRTKKLYAISTNNKDYDLMALSKKELKQINSIKGMTIEIVTSRNYIKYIGRCAKSQKECKKDHKNCSYNCCVSYYLGKWE